MSNIPYNPLEKGNLAKSIGDELLESSVLPLAGADSISGSGVYVIYYTGAFNAYAPIAESNKSNKFDRPIYIGKAIPKGGRKGGLVTNSAKGKSLAERLRQHAASIDEASNLELNDFQIRHLVIDDIWIPLGENVLIEKFKPLWNIAIDGFGNKDPGKRRANQFKSPWDVLHPGRRFAEKLADSELNTETLLQRVSDYLAGRPLSPLPRTIVRQQAELIAQAEDEADEI